MRLDRILLVVILGILLLYFLASLFLYSLYPWLDMPLHIAGGVWLGLLFFYLFLERHTVLPRTIRFVPLVFLCVGFAAFIGIGWECYEYLSQVFVQRLIPFGGSVPELHFDTLKDLFNDVLGAGLAAIWYFHSRLRAPD